MHVFIKKNLHIGKFLLKYFWKWQEIKAVQLEEALMEGEGEMEVSDSEDEPQRKKQRNLTENHEDIERVQILKEENDSLRCQLEAYKNEVRTFQNY